MRETTKHAKARQRRYLKAQERLVRDRRQAQHVAEALQQAPSDLGLPEDLATEIEGRLRSQHKLLEMRDCTKLTRKINHTVQSWPLAHLLDFLHSKAAGAGALCSSW